MEKEGFKPRANQINDTKIRFWCIPTFGIIIPNVTGLFGIISYNQLEYWLGYLFFMLISFVIWHGNRWLLFKQREHYNWFNNPVPKIVMMLFANIFYTAPVTVLLCVVWYTLAGFNAPDWDAIQKTSMMNVIAVVFITHIYETVFLIKEREGDLLQFEKLQRSKAQAELEALKNQIDPHFMFNSLNTLSFLIEQDKEKALLFNDNLADVYRYILMNKDKELIELKDELEFLQNYYSLLQIRFGESIHLTVHPKIKIESYLLPPISIQILLENAVKHNDFDEEAPLTIIITEKEDYLHITNTKRLKIPQRKPSQTGLKNLNERYKLITEKGIEVTTNEEYFSVKLPLLKIK